MSDTATYRVRLGEQDQTFNVSMETSVQIVHGESYEGDYEVTPTTEAITLNTMDKTLLDNIVINPIPSNYGLITWNGSTLMVS